ncbi:MAG TPA: serine/threonine-protein kinase, partial [Kofleriaceae bacterium]|nr:serine/threonine-protein kinase [Kofleriaceae bacterium]
DRRLRRDVVIKVTHRDHGPIDPRFEREALITARLQHPSIVRVYDAGVLGDGRAFYAMERVRGRSLEVIIGESKNLRERLALLPHAIAVCDAIAYAHSEGVLHRDLKPSNVLIGPFGETVVIDWGLAKEIRDADESGERQRRRASTPLPVERAADADLTQHGAVLGTPSYMAPEQARGEPSDERSDIYALGALLYTMICGAPPHRGKTTAEVLEQVAEGKHVPIAEREPGLPAELATLIEHAMAHDPKGRIASAKELAEELRRFAAGKLLASHSYSLRHLIRRWLWRNRIAVGIATLAIIVLAVVAVYAVKNVVRERDIANKERRRADNERNNMVLDQARASLSSDPSLAAAWLTKLNGDAYDWPQTREVAVEAARMGLARELRGHTQDVELLAVSPDGIHIATGSDDSTVRWWDLRDGTSIELRGHTGPLEGITMSPDGKYLASAGTDHDIWLWELSTGTGRKLSGHTNTVRGVAFSPDSMHLASTSEDGTLWVWDVTSATGRLVARHHHGLRPVIWYDDATVIVGGYDGMMGRFDATTGKGSMQPAHAAELRCFALSPDHRYLVAGDEDGLVTLWTATGTRIGTLGRHLDVTRKVIFTPDGSKVISAGGDEHVLVHPIPDGKPIELAGNMNGVKDIELSHDGKYVASAGIDGLIRVWTLADGKLVREFRGHVFAVKAVAFTTDGKLVSGSEDDKARVWSLADPEPPPSGPALKTWLMAHTNVEIHSPTRH